MIQLVLRGCLEVALALALALAARRIVRWTQKRFALEAHVVSPTVAAVRAASHWPGLRRCVPVVPIVWVFVGMGMSIPAVIGALVASLHRALSAPVENIGLLLFGLACVVPFTLAWWWIQQLLHVALDFADVLFTDIASRHTIVAAPPAPPAPTDAT